MIEEELPSLADGGEAAVLGTVVLLNKQIQIAP